MSNDKVAATFGQKHPRTEFHADCACDRARTLNSFGAKRHLCLEDVCVCMGGPGWSVPAETTGEHVWGKIAEDDPYAAFKEAAWQPYRIEYADSSEVTYSVVPNEDLGPKGARVYDWTPTKGELALALGIVVFIIVIFCFIVLAY